MYLLQLWLSVNIIKLSNNNITHSVWVEIPEQFTLYMYYVTELFFMH